jgi:hypothetical protein
MKRAVAARLDDDRQVPLRVLHAPWNVGGHPGQIARAERLLGLESHAVELRRHRYSFDCDEVLTDRDAHGLAVEAARWRLLRRALRDFDVIHLNFGQSILEPEPAPSPRSGFSHSVGRGAWQLYARAVWMADLPILKGFGKTIAVTFQGDDVRQGSALPPGPWPPGYYTERTDLWKRRAVARFDRYADLIYGLNPDIMRLLPARARFLPYANVEPRDWPDVGIVEGSGLIVAHAPTHRGIKGSEDVLATIERLRSEGEKIEILLVENKSPKAAHELYRKADLLIDQLLLGWYGGLAVEFMALGKPVLAHIREADLSCIPAEMRDELPVIDVTPETLYATLKDMLSQSRTALAELGRRGRRFVERWHDPREIAMHLARDYREAAGLGKDR